MQQSSSAAIRFCVWGLHRGLQQQRLLFASSGAAAAYVRPTSPSSSAADHGQQQQQQRMVPLDFNEVRLVGRVAKVLDLGAQRATFVLTTQRVVRRRPPVDAAAAADSGADGADAAPPTFRKEFASHLVVGNVSGRGGDFGADGTASGDGFGDSGWQQYLYPGSRVEVVGQLSFRPVRRQPSALAAADVGDDAEAVAAGAPAATDAEAVAAALARKFESFVRLTRLAPAGGSAAQPAGDEASAGGYRQQQQQRWRQQQQRWRQPQQQRRADDDWADDGQRQPQQQRRPDDDWADDGQQQRYRRTSQWHGSARARDQDRPEDV